MRLRGARLYGTPRLDVAGTLEVGDRLVLVARPARTELVVAHGALLRIGKDVVIGHGVSIGVRARVEIGDGVHIAPFATIIDTDFHRADDHGDPGATRPVEIGMGARIGARATILMGSRIGAGARVAPASVVSGNVAPAAHVAGVPARSVADVAPDGTASVAETVRNALGLDATPDAHQRPGDIPEWSSLGALRILLALEERFSVTLSPDHLARIATVADLERLVRDRVG